jgi:hypothetical protein
VRFAFGPWPRPRWAIAIPIAALTACVAAVCAALAHDGSLAALWRAWSAAPVLASSLRVLPAAADAAGPIVLVAAAAGIATASTRGRTPAAALLSLVIAAIAIDVRAGTVVPATPIAAALAAGLGLARLSAIVRHPVGQACAAAAAAAIALVAPVWTLAAA